MFIHSENALKAHQHISYCSIQRDYFKKNVNTKSEQNFTKTHQIAHFFQFFFRRVPCPLACVQLISLFLYEKNLHSECNQNIH